MEQVLVWALVVTGEASALVVTSAVLLEACSAADVCAGCVAAALSGVALCRAVPVGASRRRLHQIRIGCDRLLCGSSSGKLLCQEGLQAAQVQSAGPGPSGGRRVSRQHQAGPPSVLG